MPTRRAVTTLLEITGIMVMASWLTHLVLLCHKMADLSCWQQGHLTRLRVSARAMMTPTVVIELSTWRSGRIGGSAGSITWG